MKRAVTSLAMCTTLLLSACKTTVAPDTPGAPGPTPETAPGSSAPPAADIWGPERAEVMALLAYHQRLTTMSAEEARRENVAATQAFARERSEQNRLRLAMVLSVPGTSFHDDGRSAALLDTSTSRSAAADSPRRQLVTLLSRHVADRARLASAATRAEAQVKDEQKRVEDLQRKLDALLKIDREMRNRRRAIP